MPTPSAQQRQGDHREVWSRKAVLREVYGHLYRKMTDQCIPGLSIEVGGGSGNMKQLMPNTLSFDIVPEPWLDFVADAQSLPFRTGSVSNILMLDVLHHIEFPLRFFREADRVLRPGGRIVAMEPGITLISHVAYSALHEEPVDMTADPLIDGRPSVGKDPYTGNQAIPTLLVRRFRAQLSERVPGLQLRSARWLSLFAYPLSGGFKRWSLLPARAAAILLRIEDAMEPLFGVRVRIQAAGGLREAGGARGRTNLKVALAKFANRLYDHAPALYRALYSPYKAWSDRSERAFLRSLIRPGMTVLDVGANIGIYTSFLAELVGPTGRVVAFEPEKRNVDRLRSAVGLLRQVQIVHAAVTDRSGAIELFVADDLNVDHHTYASDGRRSEKVAAVALDDFMKIGERVDLIKMDIQGAEAAALRGAQRVLAAVPGPTLLMEYWPYGLRRAGEDPLALLALLRTSGFEWETVGRESLPSPDGADPNRYVNIIAKRHE